MFCMPFVCKEPCITNTITNVLKEYLIEEDCLRIHFSVMN